MSLEFHQTRAQRGTAGWELADFPLGDGSGAVVNKALQSCSGGRAELCSSAVIAPGTAVSPGTLGAFLGTAQIAAELPWDGAAGNGLCWGCSRLPAPEK